MTTQKKLDTAAVVSHMVTVRQTLLDHQSSSDAAHAALTAIADELARSREAEEEKDRVIQALADMARNLMSISLPFQSDGDSVWRAMVEEYQSAMTGAGKI